MGNKSRPTNYAQRVSGVCHNSQGKHASAWQFTDAKRSASHAKYGRKLVSIDRTDNRRLHYTHFDTSV